MSCATGQRTGQSPPLHLDPDRPNRRLKLIGVQPDDLSAPELRAYERVIDTPVSGFDKLIHYTSSPDEMPWIRRGFRCEGTIDGFFANGTGARLWARFAPGRDVSPGEAEHHAIVVRCLEKAVRVPPPPPAGWRCTVADPEDAGPVGVLLRATFSAYPSALDDRTLRRKIRTGSSLFLHLVTADGELAAVASAEIDFARGNAEMTDCATAPGHRGQGLMGTLLRELEVHLYERNQITDLYSLARAGELPMNSTFARLGYRFGGRLINNCRMPSGWESMNIWTRSSADRLDRAG